MPICPGRSTRPQTDHSRFHLAGPPVWALAALLSLQAQVLPAQDGLDDQPGAAGFVNFDLDANRFDTARACAVQPDGKIVLAGYATDDDGEENKIAVARVGLDGHPDTTFGSNDGRVAIDFTAFGYALKDGRAAAVLVDEYGGLLVVGTVRLAAGGPPQIFVTRLLANGSIDPNFFYNGITSGWYFSTAMRGVGAAALDAAGILWIVGPEDNGQTEDWVVLRLNPNGTDLGSQQILIGSSYEFSGPSALLFQPDGKAIVGGWAQTPAPFNHASFVLHRLLFSGASWVADPTFGFTGDGWVTLEYPQTARLRSMALLPDGGFAVAGDTGPFLAENLVVQRMSANGLPDGTFEEYVAFDVGGSGGDGTYGASRMVAQSDGKIVVAARVETGDPSNTSNVGVARLLRGGGLDPSFGGLGTGKRVFSMATPPPGSGDDFVTCLVLAAGKPVVGGFGEYIAPDYDFAFRRLKSSLIFTDGFESGTTFFW